MAASIEHRSTRSDKLPKELKEQNSLAKLPNLFQEQMTLNAVSHFDTCRRAPETLKNQS
jgi:hypothetical protein